MSFWANADVDDTTRREGLLLKQRPSDSESAWYRGQLRPFSTFQRCGRRV